MPTSAHVRQVHCTAPWLFWVARCGIVAQGMIYLLIGGLALVGAFDPAEHPSGSRGAMAKLDHAPLGDAMLPLLALGLAAFVLWQVTQAVLDPECHASGIIRRGAARIQHLWNAALHAVLVGIAAEQLLENGRSGDHGQTRRHLTALVMQWPGGRWLLGGIGIAIAAFALVEWIAACRPEHDMCMDLSHTRWRRPILTCLMLGHAARGALFGLIGALLFRSAWRDDPYQVKDVAGALQSMREQPFGAWLLGAVAVGLIAFGLAQIGKARYRVTRNG
jgi:hypothetical protein